jgi:hypothetical protein
MVDTRTCEHCGTVFAPRREHARFCSARCRVAWNRENVGEAATDASALQWAITAMCDTTERLPRVRAGDRARAFAVISEAVWWVTIVDATLVRYHPDAYDAVLADQPLDERRLTEGTLAGLRFVRNRMGHEVDHVDFIQPQNAGNGNGTGNSAGTRNGSGARSADPGTGTGDGRITAWTWKSTPEPTLASLSPRGQDWEMTRYQAYQAQIAGHTVSEVFGRAAAFLKRAAASSASTAEAVALAGSPTGAGHHDARAGLTQS